MAYENNEKRMESVYSQRIRAGKRRTYFFDVRETRGNDYYLTITESRKKFNEDGYDRHKIFLYKEDFNKFLKGITEAVDYVKTDLMPDYDFDAFSHENSDNYEGKPYEGGANTQQSAPVDETSENPTGIAAAATPELDSIETPKDESTEPSSTHESHASTDQSDHSTDQSHQTEEAERLDTPQKADTTDDTSPSSNLFDEEVDKW